MCQEQAETGYSAIRIQPFVGDIQRNLEGRLVNFGHTTPKDARNPQQLRCDGALRVLSLHDKPRTGLQMEAGSEARADIGKRSVAGTKEPASDSPSVQGGQPGLRHRVDGSDANRTCAGGRTGQSADVEPGCSGLHERQELA